MIKSINLNGQDLHYDLQRKQVKNINLRVKPDGHITLSANPRVPESVIEAFLQENADRILRAVEQCNAARENVPLPKEYVDGEVFAVFDERKTLRVRMGNKNSVEDNGDTILLTLKDTADKAKRQALLQAYLDGICRKTMTALCQKHHPFFAAQGVAFPTLRFRRMTSRWGSCHSTKGVVTFNYALIEKPLAFAEYVAVHELTHFLQPDHSKQFYHRLSAVLPDWKARRELGKY